MFKSGMKTWQTLFNEATEFASKIGSDRFINISHSLDQNTSVVVVWYWDKEVSQIQRDETSNNETRKVDPHDDRFGIRG